MSNPYRPRTIVEFIELSDAPEANITHKAKEIRINGVPVLVDASSVNIEFGNGELTSVTLTLFPTEIHFRSSSPRRDLA